MPTYEYACPKCGHTFERFQSMTDAPVKTCPKCKGRKVKRLLGTGAGIIFKGSGFYETDYKKSSASKSSGSGAASTSDSDSSTSKAATASDSSKSTTPPKD